MLLALRQPTTGTLQLPGDFSDAHQLLAFRVEVDQALASKAGELVIDCSGVLLLAAPVLGWLIGAGLCATRSGRRIVLTETTDELRRQIDTLSPGPGSLLILPARPRETSTSG
ncbi:MAG: STAS domain-containing protein [Nannocystaceae bacterium]